MAVDGLVVAGGAGERMRRSGGKWPKPLAPILGVTLLERNVLALLRAGLKDIHVAVSIAADGVEVCARSRCQKMAAAVGAKLSVITEQSPLGSIGAAAFLKDRQAVLVVNADNLTALDLRDIVADHHRSGAALTLAVHNQPFPIPFGQVEMQADRVIAYREKPTLVVPVCSAISILGRSALESLNPGENVGLPAFVNRLLISGADVRAFHHTAPWIDVNDLAAVERAEALVTEHAEKFELWADKPDRHTFSVMLCGSLGVVLEKDDSGVWCAPSAAAGDSPQTALESLIEARYGVRTNQAVPLAVFDEIDTREGGITRVHVFWADVIEGVLARPARWVLVEEITGLGNVSPVVLRALAIKARR